MLGRTLGLTAWNETKLTLWMAFGSAVHLLPRANWILGLFLVYFDACRVSSCSRPFTSRLVALGRFVMVPTGTEASYPKEIPNPNLVWTEEAVSLRSPLVPAVPFGGIGESRESGVGVG